LAARIAGVGGWRLATSILAAALFAVWLLLLLDAMLAPCGDFLCPGGLGWLVPVAALIAAGIVWLFASRRTAAPLYLVSAWLGAGALNAILAGPPHVNLLVLASTLYQLVAIGALVDLRRQARSALVTGCGLVVLGGWLSVARGGPSVDTMEPVVAGLLPLGAWWLSREPAPAGHVPPATSSMAG
jgi:hypothetical protein